MSYYCYLLYTNKKHTYVGATIDIDHRLRQHNGELVGGAKYTKIQIQKGLSWNRICYLTNIPEWRSALQIEWKWKQLGRTEYKNIRDPIHRRLHSLKKLLSLEKPTLTSIPYDAYPSGLPQIIWEVDEYKQYYESL